MALPLQAIIGAAAKNFNIGTANASGIDEHFTEITITADLTLSTDSKLMFIKVTNGDTSSHNVIYKKLLPTNTTHTVAWSSDATTAVTTQALTAGQTASFVRSFYVDVGTPTVFIPCWILSVIA